MVVSLLGTAAFWLLPVSSFAGEGDSGEETVPAGAERVDADANFEAQVRRYLKEHPELAREILRQIEGSAGGAGERRAVEASSAPASGQAALSSGTGVTVQGRSGMTDSLARAADDEPTFEEIVVTAQRREQRLQDVPIAVSVFGSDQMDRLGTTNLREISYRVPSFTFTEKDAAATQVFIRGIGATDDGASADNSVIIYIDGVPISRASGMNMDLFDLERVEVLRGPQGTLFGRNAVGGAVQLITQRPSDELTIRAESRAGNLDRLDFRAMLSGPISDRINGKISFVTRNRDGILDSTIDKLPRERFLELFPNRSSALAKGIDALDVDRSSVRGQLLFRASDSWEILVTGDFNTLDQSGPQRTFVGDIQQFGVGGDRLVPGFRDEFNKEFFVDPGVSEIDNWGVSVESNYEFGGYGFTSLTSFREVDAFIRDVISTEDQVRAFFSTDTPEDPLPFGAIIGPASNDNFEGTNSWTQEFRITSPAGGTFEWVAGLFYLHENVRRNETVNLGILQRDPDVVGGSRFRFPIGESGDDQNAVTNSYAVFGEATLNVGNHVETLKGLKLTAGIRYTFDDKDITRTGTADGVVTPAPFFVDAGKTFDKLTPRGIIAYEVKEDFMTYASFSRGFKSGGFQGRGTSQAVVEPPFFPETARTIELGFKSAWLDNRIRLNAAVFKTNFNDLQIVELVVPEDAPPESTSILLTTNAANAEIKGIEVDYSVAPLPGLTIQGAFAHLDTEFEEFFPPPGFRLSTGFEGGLSSRIGNRLPKAPRFATNHVIRYEWPSLALGGTLALQGEYIHKGRMFQEPENLIDVSVPKFDLFNFRLSYAPDVRHPVTVEGWIDNAFDEDFLIQSFAQDGGGRALPGEPRTYGVTLRWEY